MKQIVKNKWEGGLKEKNRSGETDVAADNNHKTVSFD